MQPTFLRSIVAAVDLSPGSDEVLRTAAELARAAGAELHVVHALDVAVAPSLEDPADPGYIRWHNEAAGRLALQLERVLPPGHEPRTRELVLDLAHRAVLARIRAVDADLVVVGPHRGRPGAAPLLGSTADRVIRTSPVPCLVVQGRLKLPLSRVVVPLDLEDPSPGALEAGFRWLAGLGTDAELAVVHVVPPVAAPGAFPRDRIAVAPPLHAAVEASRAGHPQARVREELVWGEAPADAITGYAGRERAELVVIATHGRGGVRRALLGSVASRVAAAAPCPVLMVPPSRWGGTPPEDDAAPEATLEPAASFHR